MLEEEATEEGKKAEKVADVRGAEEVDKLPVEARRLPVGLRMFTPHVDVVIALGSNTVVVVVVGLDHQQKQNLVVHYSNDH